MNAEACQEEALGFGCEGERLWGILTRPPAAMHSEPVAVLIAVGGPQYRVGSHRQFTLLARRLAASGFVSLRFDYRGMGDSEGAMRDFEAAGPDLHAALDALRAACPQALRIVVWGLCDAASAALMHLASHPAVAGIVAANPWARSAASLAAAQVQHYYGARLMQRDFWLKLLRGGIDWRGSIGTLLGNLRQSRRLRTAAAGGADGATFQTRMARGLSGFRGEVLLILSGNDLTAKEFLQFTAAAPAWSGVLANPNITRVDLAQADHTFSCRAWRAEVEEASIAWLRRLGPARQRDATEER